MEPDFPAPPLQAEQPQEPLTGEQIGVADAGAAAESVAVQAQHPEPVLAEPVAERPMAAAGPVQSASNVSSLLPPNAQSAAAKAHAFLGHLITQAKTIQADIERYVPAEFVQQAEREVATLIRAIL